MSKRDPEAIGQILKGIKKKYDEDSEDWKVMGGMDEYGNKDLIISQEPNSWWIKSKPIDPYRSISFGKELQNIDIRSIDDDIAKEVGKNKTDKRDVFHQLFGMAAPTEKDLVSAMGIQRVAPKEMSVLKQRISEKNINAELELRRKVRKTWQKQFPDRDNLFL